MVFNGERGAPSQKSTKLQRTNSGNSVVREVQHQIRFLKLSIVFYKGHVKDMLIKTVDNYKIIEFPRERFQFQQGSDLNLKR